MTPMPAALTALLLGCLIFLLIVAAIAASNAWALRRLASYAPAPDAPVPFVSILVPARNEAANIAECVRSLLAQDYAAFEVVALDDASTDDTSAILNALAADDGRLRDQLLTLLIAGHDTSTALLGWALYELGQHPAMQGRAQAEVRGALGQQLLTLENLRHLPYLEAVIKETLRHHPPIHICNRRIVRDVEFGGYRLPAGRRLLFSIYLTQHDPAVWAAPERFDPQRFYQPGAEAARPPLSYLPFGAGPRFCVGAAFAQLEVRAVLAYVLQRFDLAAGPGQVSGEMGATLTPHPAVRLAIRRG